MDSIDKPDTNQKSTVLGSSMDSIDKPHTDQKSTVIKVATCHPKSTVILRYGGLSQQNRSP